MADKALGLSRVCEALHIPLSEVAALERQHCNEKAHGAASGIAHQQAGRLCVGPQIGQQCTNYTDSANGGTVEITSVTDTSDTNYNAAYNANGGKSYHAETDETDCQRSKDGTIKYLFPTAMGKKVETVFIPDKDRATLCVSSQVGCKMNCLFCQTGKQGYEGSLSATDILNQIYSLPERDRLTNIVFMGQGEPMDNLDNVLRATEVLTADYGYAWSPKRITVSSVGVRNKLQRFLNESECHVAISLHSAIPDKKRRSG